MRDAEPRYRAVVVGASLGGSEALQVILGALTAALPVPVLVALHLGRGPRRTDRILSERSQLPVRWAVDGAAAEPGQVYLCPGQHDLRLEPDGSLSVQERHRPSSIGQIDELFASAADALGPEVLGVLLTGMASDGRAGAQAIKAAGGTVVAQDELTSTAFALPSAAIEAGVVDLVLPLGEISGVLDDVVGRGRRLPLPGVRAIEQIFAAGGEMGRRIAATEWARSPLGPVEGWPESLRIALSIVLGSPLPMAVAWGPSMVQLYNDAARALIGDRHPKVLGRPLLVTWAGLDDRLAPMLRRVWEGEAQMATDQPYAFARAGYVEELFFTASFSPLRDGAKVAGVLVTAVETSGKARAARRQRALHALANVPVDEPGGEAAACERAAAVLAERAVDVPFALIYLTDSTGTQVHLAAAAGLEAGTAAAPHTVSMGAPTRWPIHAALRDGEATHVDDLHERFPGLAAGPWPEPPVGALVLPVGRRAGEAVNPAIVILGVSPRAPLDAEYRAFLDLVAEQIGATVLASRRRREAAEREVALAELDRTKTEFFANVSDEFRTPLTMMLLPLEDLLADRDALGSASVEALELAHRNALRLLKLVNTLLEFSQAEQGRMTPQVRPVGDLAALTADLAAVYRPAIERAGLELLVDCPPLGRPVSLDPGMWERIVLNLLSNALKHTFAGTITVSLRLRSRHAELEVVDTGVGIPAEEIPELFTRFHRVHGTRTRSHEGSGVGLALVQQLARLHGGGVRARSDEGQGSRFTVWVPLVTHTRGRPGAESEERQASTARRRAFAEEADLWLAGTRDAPAWAPAGRPPAPTPPRDRPAVLLVDDNADMRTYVRRLLAERYYVTAVASGRTALETLRARRFDLVLAEVALGDNDGLELLHRLRTEAHERAIPVVLLSAVAQSTPTLRGLAAGAQDYIVKPFTARELIARIDAQLALGGLHPAGTEP